MWGLTSQPIRHSDNIWRETLPERGFSRYLHRSGTAYYADAEQSALEIRTSFSFFFFFFFFLHGSRKL